MPAGLCGSHPLHRSTPQLCQPDQSSAAEHVRLPTGPLRQLSLLDTVQVRERGPVPQLPMVILLVDALPTDICQLFCASAYVFHIPFGRAINSPAPVSKAAGED